ncbi:MAG TPA: hypothetical protein PLR99_02920 [Polyangiaceae bacterium]|nr:hypothetical protein [Polyangiaceae bacterium]
MSSAFTTLAKPVACTALLVLLGAPLLAACKSKEPGVGAKVQAPWSRGGMYQGKIKTRYGKLAEIDFDDGDHGWAEVTALQPKGTPLPTPADPCAFAVGAKIRAPWSRTMSMYDGVVDEVHGKLLHVAFDDGDKGWALCSQARER